MNRLIITLEATFDGPVTEEQRLEVIDRLYADLASGRVILLAGHTYPFDIEVGAELHDE